MAKSLLEVLRDVSLDPTEQAAFTADPSGYLAQYGYEDVQPDDISEAFGLVADTLPPELAQTVAESQAAGQFAASADEGLATNGVPTFGAGYEAVVPDSGDGAAAGGEDAFGDDLAFGEGSGGDSTPDDAGNGAGDGEAGESFDPDSFGEDANLQEAGVDDPAAGDGFGESTEPDYDDSFGDGESGFGDSDDDGFDDPFGDADDIGSF